MKRHRGRCPTPKRDTSVSGPCIFSRQQTVVHRVKPIGDDSRHVYLDQPVNRHVKPSSSSNLDEVRAPSPPDRSSFLQNRTGTPGRGFAANPQSQPKGSGLQGMHSTLSVMVTVQLSGPLIRIANPAMAKSWQLFTRVFSNVPFHAHMRIA